jgi:Flp pilus assembly pilin Flp
MKKNERGQSTVEYALLIVFCCLAFYLGMQGIKTYVSLIFLAHESTVCPARPVQNCINQ